MRCLNNGLGRDFSGRGQQQGIAIRRYLGHRRSGDHGAGVWAVLHQHGLAGSQAHLLRQQAGDDVHAAAGRVAHQDLHGSAWIGGLGLGSQGSEHSARHGRQSMAS
jgi:hypothetical protein